MIDFSPLYQQMRSDPTLASWAEQLPVQLDARFANNLHGKLPEWLELIARLPRIAPDLLVLDQGTVSVAKNAGIDDNVKAQIKSELLKLSPWRKGPFNIHGVFIDTEWRSDWKWDRLSSHIAPLAGRKVLDIGCGSGYHCWRMAGEQASLVIGLDPSQLFMAQFLAIRHFLGDHWPVHYLPLGIEAIPTDLNAFDSVFSMGVLYHRRSPIDHLMELKSALNPGGELVLETLVIDGKEGETLLPRDRYSKMRNVWFIPTVETLIGWMKRCGFSNVRAVDVSVTTVEEQHATEWMLFESLSDYLNPRDNTQTIEGYPAPKRAILLANRAS